MFKITLSPQFSDGTLRLEKRGSILAVGDKSCDFSQLADGSNVPAEAVDSEHIIGGITKINGVVNITIRMPYSDAEAPEHVRFPGPIMMIDDGEIIFNEKVAAHD